MVELFPNLPNPFPLPTDLADVQVLVNDAPVPLFFVEKYGKKSFSFSSRVTP